MTARKKLFLTSISLAVLSAVAFSFGSQADAPAAATAPPPPPEVPVAVAAQKPTQIWKDFSGRLQAVDYVEIRPEVNGKIQEIKFTDGAHVNKDDVLLVIDPAPYQAAVEKAKADLQVAKNQYSLAQKDLQRAEDLVKTEAISKRIYDERKSGAQVSKSQVDSADAQLKQAQIDLDHAFVKAPISGRISRAEITVGNFVTAASAPVLTTIVSDQGIYADFDVDEQTYLNNVYKVARDTEAQTKIPVEMVLKSDASRIYKGEIQSFDNKIDPKSGTIRVRALFTNEDQSLLPGMFVNVRLGSAGEQSVLTIPETAISTDQDRKYVYVVDAQNKIVYREVQLGATLGEGRIVTAGVKPGDKIVTGGTQKVKPDMVVAPKIGDSKATPPAPSDTEPSAK